MVKRFLLNTENALNMTILIPTKFHPGSCTEDTALVRKMPMIKKRENIIFDVVCEYYKLTSKYLL